MNMKIRSQKMDRFRREQRVRRKKNTLQRTTATSLSSFVTQMEGRKDSLLKPPPWTLKLQ